MLKSWLHRGAQPIGIDVGASGARLLQLRSGSGGLSVVGAAQIDARRAPGGEPYDEGVFEAIRRRLEAGGFSGRQCVLSVPDGLLRVRSVRQPVMPESEADEALGLEAGERLGFTDERPGEVGWLRAGRVRQGDETRDEVILVGAERAALERLVDAASDAGLHTLAVEPGFVAAGRCHSRKHRRATDQDNVRVAVDVGSKNSGMMVLRGADVAFYKPLRISGVDFTKAASERLDLDAEATTDLRRQRAAAVFGRVEPCDPSVDRALYESARPLMDDLAREVAMCLRYYSVAFTGQRPEAAVVVGGEAYEPGLAPALAASLHVDTSLGEALEDVELRGDPTLSRCNPALAEWSVAAGLSLRHWMARVEGAPDRRGRRAA